MWVYGVFLDAQGQLTLWYVVQSGQNLNTYKILYAFPHYLQLLKGSDQQQTRKSGDIDFLDIQEQQTM